MIRQTVGWASGKTKPAPPAKPKPRRRRRKMSNWGKALTTFWAASGLFALGFAYFYEAAGAAFAAAGSMAFAGVTVWAEKHRNTGVPTPAAAGPKPAKPAKPGKTARSGRGGGQPGTVKCTRTGEPIDRCGCAARHVATGEGARRYRRKVGDPLGGGKVSTVKPPKAVKPKQPRVPTTSNARPIPVGEHMRREY